MFPKKAIAINLYTCAESFALFEPSLFSQKFDFFVWFREQIIFSILEWFHLFFRVFAGFLFESTNKATVQPPLSKPYNTARKQIDLPDHEGYLRWGLGRCTTTCEKNMESGHGGQIPKGTIQKRKYTDPKARQCSPWNIHPTTHDDDWRKDASPLLRKPLLNSAYRGIEANNNIRRTSTRPPPNQHPHSLQHCRHSTNETRVRNSPAYYEKAIFSSPEQVWMVPSRPYRRRHW